MKIAKYIFLLLLLISGTISVFIATKDGSYFIQKRKIIDVSKDLVYKYVADKSNWDSINPWKSDSFKIINRENTDTETITYTVLLNEVENELKLEVRDTLNKKTVAIWSTKGKQSFKDKLLSVIGRGTKNDFEDRFEEALTAINNTLTREINTFSVEVNGFVKRDTIYYIQRPIVSKLEEIPNKIKTNLPQLQHILSSTGTPSNGNPFIVYHSKDTLNNKYTYSLAIPVKSKIYTTADSDILTGQINPSSTIKATLTGNYHHKPQVYEQLKAYMVKNKLEISDKFKEIEVLLKSSATDKLASKWVTEIYLPVRPKAVTKPVVAKPINSDSITKAIIKDVLGK
ncbi:AraC family transcriptional regulator [Flavobacterium amnicola]|uniref:AraC family transcriptional regulator n=1 Tax=Flavobacterium amnicola TaxID=2506422 RepID=A0A4Q1K4H0_9FLAO|nr:GyrI-like domain-containing protein [Flavobacterium amnicola]RXR19321.1 AraC family transcriptional regulator [Flavobacterium amnicola]